MLKIISANRLADGLVVNFIAEGNWTTDIAEAQCFTSEAGLEGALRAAKADENRNLIVDPFSVDVKEVEAKSVEALSLRNAIRAKGPTIDYLPRREEGPRS